MNLKVESGKWEKCIEDEDMIDYDNYVSGFTPISDGDFQFDTVRVFITVNKKTPSKVISAYPWVKGETYTAQEHLVSNSLQSEINNLIKTTKFYKNLHL